MRVGYLGPEGTFSEEAGRVYLKKIEDQTIQMVPFNTIHSLLYAVDRGKITEGITPYENSIEGTVGAVTDTLAAEVNLKIKQEIVIPIYHYLMAQKGVKLSQITDLISHPQSIEQCRKYIQDKLPKARVHLSFSNSQAAKQVAMSVGEKILGHFAAIGPLASAKLYGLNVLASKINAADNQTRFVVAAKKDHPRTGRDKTSIVFSIARDMPGGLYNILGEFAERKINLTKIESRPSKKALGDYFFFLDMQGHREDDLVAEALKNVKKKSAFFKNLGSYPVAVK